MPIPEREYMVFEDWFFDIELTNSLDWYRDTFTSDLTLYSKWMNEDEGVPYIYVILDDGTVEIREYTGKRRFITMPSIIEGRPVTRIGMSAFRDNTTIRELILPETLKYIDEYAFARCTALTHIQIPKSVEAIAPYAFFECVRLSTVGTVQNGALKSVGDFAFGSCSSLSRFDIPTLTESLTPYAFLGASNVQTVTVAEGNTHFSIKDRALANYPGTEIIYFPAGISGSYTIPEGVLKLGDISFINTKLQQVFIKADVKEIGSSAFKNSDIYIAEIGKELTKIGSSAFAGSEIKRIFFDEGSMLEIIGDSAFYECQSLREITLPEQLKSIGASAFELSSLYSITIPANVESIGASVFKDTPLFHATIAAGSKLSIIPAQAFFRTEIVKINLPEGIQAIESGAFAETPLTEITLHEGLKTIGGSAFASTALLQVQLPASLSSVGEGAFSSCQRLQNISVASGNEAYASQEGVLYTKDLKTLHTFPAGRSGSYKIISEALTVGNLAFAGALIENVDMFDSVTHIGESAFEGASKMHSIRLSSELLTLSKESFFGCLALGSIALPDKITEIPEKCFAGCISLESISWSEELKSINSYAFMSCSSVGSINNFPEKLQYIHEGAFSGCTDLHTVSFPASLLEIGGRAFAVCSSLSNISITKNIQRLGEYCFEECWNLGTVSFEADGAIKRLSLGSFRNSGLVSITIPKFINTIAQYEFAGCKYLRSVTFEEGSEIEALTAYMFAGADALETITFPENFPITSIQAHALEGMENLININLEACTRLTSIDNYAFRYCKSLADITIPEGVENIGRYAFLGCYSLEELTLPKSLKSLGESAFFATKDIKLYFANDTLPESLENNWDKGVASYTVGVTDVISTDKWIYALLSDGTAAIIKYLGTDASLDLTEIGGYPVSQISGGAFDGNKTLESVILPDGLNAIYSNAFRGTSSLLEITIPATVKHIETGAFYGSGIESITFKPDSSLATIGQYAFAETKNLKNAAIPGTVTEIRDFAFYNSAVESITFGAESELKSVGSYAFAYSRLISFDFPKKLGDIGTYAFAYTEYLASVDLLTDVEVYIGASAFYNSGLENVTIPENVRYIGESAFAYCQKLLSFIVAEGSMNYSSLDGALFNKQMTKLITYPGGKSGTYTVPSSVVTMGVGAFEGSRLTGVIFPENSELITIGYRAFINAKSLESIVIPDSIISIDFYAFAYCDSLKTVTIGENSQLSGIYEGAFYNCNSLEAIYIPSGIQEISSYAFYGCTKLTKLSYAEDSKLKGVYKYAFSYSGLTEIILPQTLIEIGDGAFANMTNAQITKLEIPENVEYIGKEAFLGQKGVEELTIPAIEGRIDNWFGNELPNLKKLTVTKGTGIVGDNLLSTSGGYGYPGLETIVLHDGITRIGNYALSGCPNLKEIELPDTLISIGKNGLAGIGLSSICIPDSVTSIDEGAFAGSKMTDVQLPKNLLSIENGLFYDSDIRTLTIPESVIYIDMGAFERCFKLECLNIGKNVKAIDISAAPGGGGLSGSWSSAFVSISVDGQNPYFASENGILYNKEKTRVIIVPSGLDAEGKLAETVTHIGASSFANNTETGKLTIHEGVIVIEAGAFHDSGISSVSFPESLKRIEQSAFNMACIYSVTLPENIEYIGDYAFDSYGHVAGFVFVPESVSYFGADVFGTKNTKVLPVIAFEADTLPAGFKHDGTYFLGIKEIGNTNGFGYLINKQNKASLYNYDGNAEEITIPEAISGYPVETLCERLFAGNTYIKKVVIPSNITQIPEKMFYECTNLQEVQMHDNIVSIAERAFDLCYKLKSIELPKSLKSIGAYAFESCWSLKTLTLPASLESIGKYAFNGCEGLESLVFTDDISLFKNVFTNCAGLRYIIMPELPVNAYSLFGENNATLLIYSDKLDASADKFSWYTGFLEIHSENGFDFAILSGGRALLLSYNGNAEELVIPEKINGNTVIGSCALVFKNNQTIKSVTLPSSFKTIPAQLFSGCQNLETVIAPDTLKGIGDYAFYNCKALKSLSASNELMYIGKEAFRNCDSLTNISISSTPAYIGAYAFPFNSIIRFESLGEPLPYWSENWQEGLTDVYPYQGSVTIIWGDKKPNKDIYPEGLIFDFCCSTEDVYANVSDYVGPEHIIVEIPEKIAGLTVKTFIVRRLNLGYVNAVFIIPETVQFFNNSWHGEQLFLSKNDKLLSASSHNLYLGIKDYGIENNIVYFVDESDTASAVYLTNNELKTVYIADYFRSYPVRFLRSNMLSSAKALETLRIPFINESLENLFGYSTTPATLANLIIGPNCIELEKLYPEYSIIPNKNLVIYCYQDKDAVLWGDGWNEYYDHSAMDIENPYKKFKTYYLGEWNEVSFNDYAGQLIDYYPLLTAEIIKQPAELQLVRPNSGCTYYDFIGWDLNGDGSADIVPAQTGIKIDAHALYSSKIIHTEEVLPEKAPTCTKTGLTEGLHCSVCKEIFTAQNEVPATGHTESEWIIDAELSCTVNGLKHIECIICKKTLQTQTQNALNHDKIFHSYKSPSCEDIGWQSHYTCSRCDYTTYVEIPAAGHIKSDWIFDRDSTCTEDGSAHQECTVCAKILEEVTLPAFGHAIAYHEAKAPTCLSIGWEAYQYCLQCSYTTYQELQAKGHDIQCHDAKEPDCINHGWNAYDTCSRCDYKTYVEIPKLGHNLVHHDAKAPACNVVGFDAYDSCSRCDYTTYVEIPKLGHDLVRHDAKAPDCINHGWNAYDTCSRCDYTTYVEIPKLAHDLVHHDAKAPACNVIGFDAYDTCSRCDYTSYVEISFGHDLVHHDGKAAECEAPGFDAYDTCCRCDYTTYKEIAAKGHKLSITKRDNTHHWKSCSCGKEGEKSEHAYGRWGMLKDNGDGTFTKSARCSCGKEIEITVNSKDEFDCGLSEESIILGKDLSLELENDASKIPVADKAAIEESAGDMTFDFFDIKIIASNEALAQTNNVIEIAIPYNTIGKYSITVWRNHNGTVSAFEALTERPEGERRDSCFYVDTENSVIYIYSNLFSTYAVGYSDKAPAPPPLDNAPDGKPFPIAAVIIGAVLIVAASISTAFIIKKKRK